MPAASARWAISSPRIRLPSVSSSVGATMMTALGTARPGAALGSTRLVGLGSTALLGVGRVALVGVSELVRVALSVAAGVAVAAATAGTVGEAEGTATG